MSLSMESEIKKWLEINTFICPHGLGRLSPEQCRANRERCDLSEAKLLGLPPKPWQCYKCTEWKELIEEVKKRRKSMAKVDICKLCGKQLPIKARGLCSSCYNKQYREGKLDSVTKSNMSLKIILDFSDYPNLYNAILTKAEKEMRNIRQQVLWELKNIFQTD